MTRLLVTGFGSFPGAPVNPTGEIVGMVAAMPVPAGLTITTHLFRTAYSEVLRDLPALLSAKRPDIVLMFGLAKNASTIRIETTARNATNRHTPDVEEAFFPTRRIGAGPSSRRTRLDGPPMAQLLRRQGLPATTSRNAGTYLCNFLYFLALEAAERGDIKQALFVHVPLPVGLGDTEAHHTITAQNLATAAKTIITSLTTIDMPG